jgi:tetratricopeptide (TPR) repeat protein
MTVPDASEWLSVSDDDPLWSSPTADQLPPPLATPLPPLLNTHEMGWEQFERLVAAMARELDGAYYVRRYGRSGQAQHGLDTVGSFTGRPPTVYQAKEWQRFGASDLEEAVLRYSGGRRPFGADRLIIAVGSEVRDTAVDDRLHQLRQDHRDLAIVLWDRGEISERLRSQPNLVRRFFGEATARNFCDVPSAAVPEAPRPSIAAEAIVRGPIAYLGMLESFRRAREALDTDPPAAADLLRDIAERLEAGGFVPHAALIRDLQAKSLGAAGDASSEASVRLRLGWGSLDAGDPFAAQAQARELAKWTDAPSELQRAVGMLAAVAGYRAHAQVPLDDVAAAFDALQIGDPFRVDGALALAEEAIADRRENRVSARADTLLQLAADLPQDADGLLDAARLRMCVADAAGGWEELAEAARRDYPARTTAWVLARHARHLAMVGNTAGSVARWTDAIERACVEQLNDDAADWLYSSRTVRMWGGWDGTDLNEPHRLAQALRAAGSGTVLREPYPARERALDRMDHEKWPDALEALRHYLRRSTVLADLEGEVDAHAAMGRLFAQTGRPGEAARHFVFAADSKELEALAAKLPDQPLSAEPELLTVRPWERAAAYAYVAAAADLLVDDNARWWCTAAFDDVERDPGEWRPFAPNPWLAAFKTFAQVGGVASVEEAAKFLEFSRTLIPRDPNTYRHTDEAQVEATITIGLTHPVLRATALELLLECLLADQRMADLVLGEGAELLRGDPKAVVAKVGPAAQDGDINAALAVVEAGGGTDAARPEALRRLESALRQPERKPGVFSLGTILPRIGFLIRVLPAEDRVRFANAMLERARATDDVAQNRADALIALQVVGAHLPDRARDEMYVGILPFGAGEYQPGVELPSFAGADDPLSRMRISVGTGDLEAAGLLALAALARSAEQAQEVEEMVLRHLRADAITADAGARTLLSLPGDLVHMSVPVLSTHSSPAMRAMGAVLWARRPDEPEAIGTALARDPARVVRASLASALGEDSRHDGVRTILARDPRRSVRRRVTHGRLTSKPC